MASSNRFAAKPAPAGAPRYRIKAGAPDHFIGSIKRAGDIVVLREGVKPGKWLEPIDAPKAEKSEADGKSDKADKSAK